MSPLTCCREGKDACPIPAALLELGCCAAERSGEDWAPAKAELLLEAVAVTTGAGGGGRAMPRQGRRGSPGDQGKEG